MTPHKKSNLNPFSELLGECMKTFISSELFVPSEAQELVLIEISQDRDSEVPPTQNIQIIPVLGVKLRTYEHHYEEALEVEYTSEVRYITPAGELDIDSFSSVQSVNRNTDLAFLSVLALRNQGSEKVSLLEPKNGGWLKSCPWKLNTCRFTTFSSIETHPTLVDLTDLTLAMMQSFPLITKTNLAKI